MTSSTIPSTAANYPAILHQLHQPPTALYCRGRSLADIMARPRVAIVGSRAVGPYGRLITRQFAAELAALGVVIVSGLALGVDAEAHRAALNAGGLTMAVLPVPVEAPSPPSNVRLAERIVAEGGTLVSAYPAGSINHKGNFVERNQIVAALSDAVLITEATSKSGTRHTVRFALDLGIPVLAVPGNITSRLSEGTNQLIKSSHTTTTTNVQDVLKAIGLTTAARRPTTTGDTPEEQRLLNLLAEGVSDGNQLLQLSRQTVSIFNQTLTMLELSGKIIALGGNQWGRA